MGCPQQLQCLAPAAMLLPRALLSVLPLSTPERCASLTSVTTIPDTTIESAVHYPVGTNITTGADFTCSPWRVNSVDICRVTGVIETSPTSTVDFEMWLPDTWYGRFLVTGNNGLGGCKPFP